ncbi:uncharacterized protein CBL_01039 [Carabus blaptoides fortunei]
MALHFSANQFNRAFDARKLGNWEVPHRYPERPHVRTGHTRIIANDRGHLLPGVAKFPSRGAWGQFIPTWRMPKRITRKIADELRAPKPIKKALIPKIPCNESPPEDLPEKLLDIEPEPVKETAKVEQNEALNYIPGDLTDPKHRPPNYNLLRPKSPESLAEMTHKPRGRSPTINPFACVYRNFEMAKKCAKENLEHHPLPDTVTDALFKKLQMERASNPGLALNEEAQTTGVGWKGYGAAGPTQCTKLRVYRPKTSAPKKLKNLEDLRPGSCGSFDKKWRFIKQKHVTPIELAICWDMTPQNPADEPKRTPHIDGSNGSLAPAVFAMVHSPKQPAAEAASRKSSASKASCDGVHGCGTVKSSSAGTQRPAGLKRPKTSSPMDAKQASVDLNKKIPSLDRRSISTNSLYVNPPHTRKFSNESNLTFASLAKPNVIDRRKLLHQSSPNLSTVTCGESICGTLAKRNPRPCAACDVPTRQELEERPKSEYKMAFKAGKVNGSKSFDGLSSSGTRSSSVKVPKQREPYAKRNYDINSLHPPFTVWKGTSCQSYPEHWRLASIYQHSYKPVEHRKRSLLSSVYQ